MVLKRGAQIGCFYRDPQHFNRVGKFRSDRYPDGECSRRSGAFGPLLVSRTFAPILAKNVVQQTLSAIEAGLDEVLADDMTRQVKAGLSDELGIYLDYNPARAVARTGA